jgi:hypothetical protein
MARSVRRRVYPRNDDQAGKRKSAYGSNQNGVTEMNKSLRVIGFGLTTIGAVGLFSTVLILIAIATHYSTLNELIK